MKTIKEFDNQERKVKLIDMGNGTYSLTIITNEFNGGKIYKSKYYAELGFKTWGNYPLNIIEERYID